MNGVPLIKTDKAVAELRPGVRNLSQRERGVLLVVDGRKTLADLAGLYEGEGQLLARQLIESGYLAVRQAPAHIQVSLLASAARIAPAAAAPAAPASADPFVGKRSLATTRMYLFDLCERMFARRDPVLAAKFRDALREARDRETMLAAGREMIEEIEQIAGFDRADAIRERIAMILPDD